MKKPSLIEITGFQIGMISENLFCRVCFYDTSYLKITSTHHFIINALMLKETKSKRILNK